MPAMLPGDDAGADALARRLAEAHERLAHAHDACATLAAAMCALEAYAPDVAVLHEVEVDERGDPRRTRAVAVWTAAAGSRPHAAEPQTIADDPLSRCWREEPDAPVVVDDMIAEVADLAAVDGIAELVAVAGIADLADLAAGPRQDLAPPRSLALLPLRSHQPEAWQGLLALRWSGPRAPAPGERDVQRFVMSALAAAIAGRRQLATHAAALAELTALQRLSQRIGEAADIHEMVAVVVAEAHHPGAQGKALKIEADAAGAPEIVEIVSVHGGGPTAAATLGARHRVADSPASPLWFDSPNTPLMIADIHTDARLTPAARALHMRSGLTAVIVVPLRWQDRWLGILQVGWQVPRQFTAAERRLYARVAPLAAAVLDNRMLVERSARAVADNHQQARTLADVLEHLPVGVMINGATDGERRLNRAGLALLQDPGSTTPRPLVHAGTDRPVAPDERLWWRAMTTGAPAHGERDLVGPDGTRRRVTVLAAPIRGEHGTITGAVSVFHDITARLAHEQAQARLHAEVLAAQREALAATATPQIPISHEVLVIPLVGAIDHRRGRRLVDAAQHIRTATRVVLLDLTGARDVDEAGAAALTQTAAILRLQGMLPVLTGLAPDVAWTLAQQVPRGLTTCATLRDGLALASRSLRGL